MLKRNGAGRESVELHGTFSAFWTLFFAIQNVVIKTAARTVQAYDLTSISQYRDSKYLIVGCQTNFQ